MEKESPKYKSKVWYYLAFYSLLLGWFPFMFLAVWGSWDRERGVIVMLVGLGLCIFGSMMIMPLMKDHDLFKSIDELEEERLKYYEARKKLQNKIVEITQNS